MDGDLLAFASWAWGLSLIVLTIAIHAIGVVIMAFVMLRLRLRLVPPGLRPWRVVPIVIGVVATASLVLAALHVIEATVWAAAYVWLGAFGSFADAMLYSVGAMTTAGASGLTLIGHWRMVGELESAGGMLLFGISTAYIFATMQVYWPMLSRRR